MQKNELEETEQDRIVTAHLQDKDMWSPYCI